MAFTLATGRELVKLGYARDPESRLTHQLVIYRQMPAAILRVVAIPSGHDAIGIEKRLHGQLRRSHPEAVVDPASYAGRIRVRSEIYEASLTPRVLALLDAVEAQGGPDRRADRPAQPHMGCPAS